jgi:hypothetical protein
MDCIGRMVMRPSEREFVSQIAPKSVKADPSDFGVERSTLSVRRWAFEVQVQNIGNTAGSIHR